MNKEQPYSRYFVLFIPWLMATLIQSYAIESYFIAWLGTILIFILTLSGWVKPLPNDLPIEQQLLRPIFLVQIIFAGYMSFTSIFYFLSLLGYQNFSHANNVYFHTSENLFELAAQCQRYYVLGHAAFVVGILFFMDYPVRSKYYIKNEKLTKLLIFNSIVTLGVSLTIGRIPGYTQFFYKFADLSFFSGTLALSFSITAKKSLNILICLILYGINFYGALTSGFKEPIIISVLVLGIFLFPNYKKIVFVIFTPLLILLFIYLPKYNQVFRQNAWKEGADVEDAYEIALDATIENNKDDDSNKWDFLVGRLSEIEMFTKYISSTPRFVNYYGFRLIKQSVIAIIPREIWHKKPITENLVMERVYKADVIGRASAVSAKPAFIVDSYLCAGIFGILFFLFIYGVLVQKISLKAEYLFGGYYLGTAIIFSGLFQDFWRGLSFEFLFNAIFWSYISMLIVFRTLRTINVIKKIH